MNISEFEKRIDAGESGHRIVYFEGELSRARELERPIKLGKKIVRPINDLAAHVRSAYDAGRVRLFQIRKAAYDFSYVAEIV